jgi:hypothetical protein
MSGSQLEFSFGGRYDIFTDRLRPIGARDIEVYQAVWEAYARTREAVRAFPGGPLPLTLDLIHKDLVERILHH